MFSVVILYSYLSYVDTYVYIFSICGTHTHSRSPNKLLQKTNECVQFCNKKLFLHLCIYIFTYLLYAHRVIFKLVAFAIIAGNCLKKIKIRKKTRLQFSPKHIFNSLCTLLSLIISTNLALPQRALHLPLVLRPSFSSVPQTTRLCGRSTNSIEANC